MENVLIKREELYQMVWREPVTALAKKYNLSDNGLRKLCARLQVPLPKQGYWSKIRAGKRILVSPLPADYSGEQEIKLDTVRAGTGTDSRSRSPLALLQSEIERDQKLLMAVPARLANPDKLIAITREWLEGKGKESYSWDHPLAAQKLDIRVSKEITGRALRFMDALLKLLRARGHDIRVEYHRTYAVVEGGKLEISLREKTTRITVKDGKWDRTEYRNTGLLVFKMERIRSKEWQDGSIPLEQRLSNIAASLELRGLEQKAWRICCQVAREERELQERIQRERERLREKELADFKKLLAEAHRWRQAKMLREYIDEKGRAAADNSAVPDQLQEWMEWARKKADWFDPYVEASDELLDDVDKATLTFKK